MAPIIPDENKLKVIDKYVLIVVIFVSMSVNVFLLQALLSLNKELVSVYRERINDKTQEAATNKNGYEKTLEILKYMTSYEKHKVDTVYSTDSGPRGDKQQKQR